MAPRGAQRVPQGAAVGKAVGRLMGACFKGGGGRGRREGVLRMAGLETDTQGRLLSRVVDAIIPGDALFPAASRVGVQEKLLERGFKTLGPIFPRSWARPWR